MITRLHRGKIGLFLSFFKSVFYLMEFIDSLIKGNLQQILYGVTVGEWRMWLVPVLSVLILNDSRNA